MVLNTLHVGFKYCLNLNPYPKSYSINIQTKHRRGTSRKLDFAYPWLINWLKKQKGQSKFLPHSWKKFDENDFAPIGLKLYPVPFW